ncbi:MAG TPA: cation:proton antiporter [Chryseolinea sp.]
MSSEDLKIPFTNPVLVFALVLLSILVTPLLLSRLKIPGVVGLILIGVALGPNGLHILERDASIILFGTVGLLYIMFMAGLEMDMNDFKKNKNKSIVFGVLTFVIPFLIGFVAARQATVQIMIARILQPLNTAKKITLALPEHVEKEKGFPGLVETILQLAKSMGASLTIFSVERSYQQFCAIMEKGNTSHEPVFQPFHQWTNLLTIVKNMEPHDVFIAVQARPQTISYNNSMEKVPRLLMKYINNNTAIVMYPRQA